MRDYIAISNVSIELCFQDEAGGFNSPISINMKVYHGTIFLHILMENYPRKCFKSLEPKGVYTHSLG